MKSLIIGIFWGALAVLCVLVGYYRAASLYVLAVFLFIIAATHLSTWFVPVYKKSAFAQQREVDAKVDSFLSNQTLLKQSFHGISDAQYQMFRYALLGYPITKITYDALKQTLVIERSMNED